MSAGFQEYLTANEQTAFPFTENAAGLVEHGETESHGPSATLPKDFLIDAVIVTPSRYYGSVYLHSIVNAGGGTFQFYIFSEERRTVSAFLLTTVPPERSLVTMRDVATGVSVRLLTGPSFASFLSSIPTTDIFDDRLRFETAVVEFRPLRLEKIILDNDVPVEVVGPDIVILPGYNVQTTISLPLGVTEEALDTTSLEITAEPGLGLGRFNECDAPPEPIDYIAKINGTGPDEDGQVFLCPDPCHRLDLQPALHRIEFYNDCTPCCECEDYANVVEVMERLFTRLRAVKHVIDDTIIQFNDHVTLYNKELWQRYRSVFLTGNGHTGLEGDITSMSQPRSGNYATLVFHVNNRSCQAITDVHIIGTATEEYQVLQMINARQNGPGNTEVLRFEGLSFGPTFDLTVETSIKPGSEATVYILMKRPWPQVASGTVVAHVEYNVGPDHFVTDDVTITWS